MHNSTKKCLVIGANSFIGRHLIAKLRKRDEVFGIYHNSRNNLFSDINYWPIEKLDDIETEFDLVYLVSAHIPSASIDKTERLKMFEANVELVDRVCSKYQSSRIVFCSSVSVYQAKEGDITEFDAEAGINEYGVSKIWGERLISRLGNYAIVRFSSVYGEGMKQNSIIPTYIRQAAETGEIKVFGSGERMQNYIYVSDAVAFLEAAGNYSQKARFLAVSPGSISNKFLAEHLAKKLNCKVIFEGGDNSPSFFYDNSYTTKTLGYECQVSFDDGINKVLKWTKEKY